ncbi:hypothetical protein H8D91_01455 [archaeon]|nr:hypothetical protein [archaeon]
MVIKKIFEGIFDDEVHAAFLKFGRGEYPNKYLIEAKRQKDKYVIKTSAEFVNYFVVKCLEEQEKLHVKGIIISTIDLSNEIPFPVVKVSNFQGVRKIQIDTELNAEDLIKLIDKYPRMFFALSFKTNSCELKIKAKAPKSGKPDKETGEVKVDFCSLKTTNPLIAREVLFGLGDFKEIRVEHTLKINEIIYPKDSSLNPAEIREQSKRKGTVVRKVLIDGNEKLSEANFEA